LRIDLLGVYKYFESESGRNRVLENINLSVDKGGFICIMGPSGSGKSTLLYLMGCLENPSFGQVILDEVDISEETEEIKDSIRLHHIGFIFQNYNLLPTLTVFENVLLPMQLSGTAMQRKVHSTDWIGTPGDWENRAVTLLRLVGLDRKLDEKISSLSGGQQQRVAIARSLANSPGLLLADEPTGNLDSRTSQEIMEVLTSIHVSQKITVVMVTHDPKVASYAREIYYLDQGHLRPTTI